MQLPRIIRAENDVLVAENGCRYIDLFSAHGTTWLGHSNRKISDSITEQLRRIWVTGGLETAAGAEAKTRVDEWFPPSHQLAGLCSTGMEAAEFAMRIARVTTGKSGVVGFENSMHGKSLATAYLGWDNKDNVRLPAFDRLPFLQTASEQEILERLAKALRQDAVSAVFIEPVQGCGGGFRASGDFYRSVYRECRERDVLLVFDEILTGFYRTGTPFFFSELGFTPDLVLIGKAMGNGFPVSGVVLDKKHAIRKEMLPGSTYSGNPLASAAVAATLAQMESIDLAARVARIERTVQTGLCGLKDLDIVLRGKGALWILELTTALSAENLAGEIYRAGVLVGCAGRHLRLLPAATIEPANLEKACAVISETVGRVYYEQGKNK